MLFADIRGFTSFAEQSSSAEASEGLSRFYALANQVLTHDDALVEFVGDQVMALYLSDFPSLGERTAEVMMTAAERLQAATTAAGSEQSLPVGIGIHMGTASVGNMSKGDTKDFTAVGDVVNTAARLQTCALAGQIVVSDEVYAKREADRACAEPVSFTLKGKTEPVAAVIIDQ